MSHFSVKLLSVLASAIFSDAVLGLGHWSLVVLEDKISVLGPGLGLEACVRVNITGNFPAMN